MTEDILTGEWWIDDGGNAIYADGDIGDDNHESIVVKACWSHLAGWLEMAEGYDFRKGVAYAVRHLCEALQGLHEGFNDYGVDQCQFREVFCNAHDELCREHGRKGVVVPKKLRDPSESPYDWLAARLKEANTDFDQDIYEAAVGDEGSKDVRVLATVKWGWIRMKGTDLDLPDFSDKTLDRLVKGIDDAYPETELTYLKTTEWNLQVWEKYEVNARPACFLVGIPYAELLNGKMLRGDSVRFAGELLANARR